MVDKIYFARSWWCCVLLVAFIAAGSTELLGEELTGTNYWVPQFPPKAHYTINCSINPSEGHIGGTETIHLTNTTSRSIDRLAVEYLSLHDQKPKVVTEVEITINGKPVSIVSETQKNQFVHALFELSDPIRPDEEADLQINFNMRGQPVPDTEDIKIDVWYPRLWWGFETHSDFNVKIEVPPEYVIATSGVSDRKSGRYHARGVRNFGLFVRKGVKVIEAYAGDVLIRCVFTPKGKKCARLILSTAVDVVNFYRERFGFYPYPCLTIIPGDNEPKGGYPVAANMVAIHGMEQMDTMPELHWRWITAHEIGHEYWGEYVLEKDPRQKWLMIGLGIYADREYVRARTLELSKHQAMMNRYTEGVEAGLDTTINLSEEDISRIEFDFNNVVIHGKGYSIISALDCTLGEETFDSIYRRCLNEFGGRRLGVHEFRTVCEEETGENLGWFFDQWVNSNKYLQYKITFKESEEEENRFISTVKVQCVGTLKMPVPVAAYFEDGTSQKKLTDRIPEVNVLIFESQSPLKDVRLDPEGKLAQVSAPPSALSARIRRLPWTGAGHKALELFRQAKQEEQINERTWVKLGLTLYDGKYYAEALECFRRLELEEVSDNKPMQIFVARVWQGHMLDLMNRREEALECYRRALKVDRGLSLRHDQYGIIINREWVERRLKEPFDRTQTIPTALEDAVANLKSADASVRQQAAWVLGKRIKDRRAVEPLIRALKDEDSEVRKNAAWALGKIKDERAVESLIAVLNDNEEKVRENAAWALKEITGEDFAEGADTPMP